MKMLTVQIASDIEHDNVVAEVNYDDEFLCLLSKDQEDKKVMIELPIELPSKGPSSMRRIPLEEFVNALKHAEQQLATSD